MNAAEAGALAGLRVLDLSRILAGPFATMVLADLGAEVIKVEDTAHGDDTRQWGPPYQGDQSAYFLSVNRNKRGISLDLKTDAGRTVALQLAERADIVVENFRPGTAARLGLGYVQVAERNPRIVYASISGFGQTGPHAAEPGYDAVAQALGGLMSVTGEEDGNPVRVGVAAADLGAAMWAVIGVLAALQARHRSGRGQWVDVSLFDGQLAWLTYLGGSYFATGELPRRRGSAHPNIVPYQAFRTRDGHLMCAVGNDAMWRRFATVLQLDSLASDPRFATNPQRVRHRSALLPVLERVMATRDSAEWATRLTSAGVPAGAINSIGAALDHPQARARDMVLEVEHATAGTVRMVGSPIKFSAEPPSQVSPPPTLGEHTDAVLAELGYSNAQVAALRAAGVVR